MTLIPKPRSCRSLQSSSNAWTDQLLLVIWLCTLFLLLFNLLTEDWSEQKETIKYTAIKPVWITRVGTEVKPAVVRKHRHKTEILSLTSPIVFCCARVAMKRILFLHLVIQRAIFASTARREGEKIKSLSWQNE